MRPDLCTYEYKGSQQSDMAGDEAASERYAKQQFELHSNFKGKGNWLDSDHYREYSAKHPDQGLPEHLLKAATDTNGPTVRLYCVNFGFLTIDEHASSASLQSQYAVRDWSFFHLAGNKGCSQRWRGMAVAGRAGGAPGGCVDCDR